jgi:hypothetical protein
MEGQRMATKLKTPVSRELENWSQKGSVGLNGKDAKRNLVVTLEPCGLISFRLKGLQSEYVIDIERVFALAAKETALKTIQRDNQERRVMKEAMG